MTIKEQYLKLVCDELKLPVELVKSKCRDRELCEARQVTSYILKKYTRCSYWSIARFHKYVSHASALRDVRKVPELMQYDKIFAKKMEPVLQKAWEFARDMRGSEENKKKQEEYDRIFASLTEGDWYNNVFYAESLMLPV